jgi:5-formyltetrahydrofolate cyclo-ligase
MNKSELRRSLLKIRQAMTIQQWQEKSDRICANLATSPLFTQAKTVLAYFSFRQEPDLSPLFTSDHRWGFPRCIGNTLHWHFCQPNDSLQRGAYGITEPNPDAPTVQPNEVDLILVPCVACDAQGYRLGYGGGYYDRLLNSSPWATKVTIGIVFDFAYTSQLPIEPWDKPLQAVCTETGFKL